MSNDDQTPDYGTPPEEPKYGRRLTDAEERDRRHRERAARLRAYGNQFPAGQLRPADPPLPDPTRSPLGIVLASILLVVAAVALVFALQGGWWLLLLFVAVPFGFFGAVGLAIDLPKVPRDDDGRPLDQRPR
jgi:hypothetical protein